MAQFEESCIQREKDPKKKLIPVLNPSDAALQHNINQLSEQNKNFKDRFTKKQTQVNTEAFSLRFLILSSFQQVRGDSEGEDQIGRGTGNTKGETPAV
jgi:hypothetical protein